MPVTSSNSSVKRWPRTEAVLDGLRAWAEAERGRRPDVAAFAYFGSYARGDAGFGSDLDLVAIVGASTASFLDRARDWPTEILPVPTDLLVYTPAEWTQLQTCDGRFAQTLLHDTVWLTGRPVFG